MENLGHYYKVKHGVDFRSLRYIGVMSPIEYAYNGSTDYASEVFYKIKRGENYDICLNKDRKLPMAYIDDIVDGTIKLLEASSDRLTQSVYNINCVDFDPEQIMAQLIKKFPKFEFRYKPDLRDEYAKTWPYNYDDHDARKDWGWNPKYDSLDKIIKKMIEETKI